MWTVAFIAAAAPLIAAGTSGCDGYRVVRVDAALVSRTIEAAVALVHAALSE